MDVPQPTYSSHRGQTSSVTPSYLWTKCKLFKGVFKIPHNLAMSHILLAITPHSYPSNTTILSNQCFYYVMLLPASTLFLLLPPIQILILQFFSSVILSGSLPNNLGSSFFLPQCQLMGFYRLLEIPKTLSFFIKY